MRRRRRFTLGSSSSCAFVDKPTTAQVRAALEDPEKEAAYFFDTDHLLYGDEMCVREGEVRGLHAERWHVHNHPYGSPPLPSNGDMCFSDRLRVARMDIVGIVDTPRGLARVVTALFSPERRWPCEQFGHPNAPAEIPSYITARGAAWPDSEVYHGRAAMTRWMREFERRYPAPAALPARDRFSKLEIDGALPRSGRPRQRSAVRQRGGDYAAGATLSHVGSHMSLRGSPEAHEERGMQLAREATQLMQQAANAVNCRQRVSFALSAWGRANAAAAHLAEARDPREKALMAAQQSALQAILRDCVSANAADPHAEMPASPVHAERRDRFSKIEGVRRKGRRR